MKDQKIILKLLKKRLTFCAKYTWPYRNFSNRLSSKSFINRRETVNLLNELAKLLFENWYLAIDWFLFWDKFLSFCVKLKLKLWQKIISLTLSLIITLEEVSCCWSLCEINRLLFEHKLVSDWSFQMKTQQFFSRRSFSKIKKLSR